MSECDKNISTDRSLVEAFILGFDFKTAVVFNVFNMILKCIGKGRKTVENDRFLTWF